MAHSISAKKRVRQNETRRLRNKSYKTRLKNIEKSLEEAIKAKKKDEALEIFKLYAKNVDSISGKGIIHKNKAARMKSRMMKNINAL